MRGILNILLVVLLFKGYGISSNRVNNNIIINKPTEEHNFNSDNIDSDNIDFMISDSLFDLDLTYDSLSTHLIDSSLISYPVLTNDIFHLIFLCFLFE